jgi:hypothetical protein
VFGTLTALIPLITGLVPALTGAMATPVAGSILVKAGEIAQRIFGSNDPTTIGLEIQRDQSKLERFKAELEKATKEDLAFLADIQSARQQTVQLAQAGSGIAWGAPVISGLITIGFFLTLAIFVLYSVDLPEYQKAVLTTLIGTLAGGFTQVISYWLGSSRSSANKDFAISSLATTAVQSNAASAVASDIRAAVANGDGPAAQVAKRMFR